MPMRRAWSSVRASGALVTDCTTTAANSDPRWSFFNMPFAACSSASFIRSGRWRDSARRAIHASSRTIASPRPSASSAQSSKAAAPSPVTTLRQRAIISAFSFPDSDSTLRKSSSINSKRNPSVARFPR